MYVLNWEDTALIIFTLGEIAGAAETLEDEATRDTIHGAAHDLLDIIKANAGLKED